MVKKLTDDFSLHFLKCKWKWTNISNHSLVLISYFVFVFLSLCQYAWVFVSKFMFVSVRLSLCLGVWQLRCWALGVEQLQWVMATLPVLVSPASELHPAAASPTLHKHKHKQKQSQSHTIGNLLQRIQAPPQSCLPTWPKMNKMFTNSWRIVPCTARLDLLHESKTLRPGPAQLSPQIEWSQDWFRTPLLILIHSSFSNYQSLSTTLINSL